jgi:hypothetical protein
MAGMAALVATSTVISNIVKATFLSMWSSLRFVPI